MDRIYVFTQSIVSNVHN